MINNELPIPAAYPAAPPLPPLRSVHTTSFPQILRDLGISLAVSTYGVGRLVLLRSGNGVLGAHFRAFPKPMGIAVAGDRLAMGTVTEIWEFHNAPSICPKLDKPPVRHDACYLPRNVQFTGDIQVHEMAWAGANRDELWFVNTRYSCLCTRSNRYSFEPRWQPDFITELAAEDRCHLNGLGVREGSPRYATALGRTNTAGGWRGNKKSGGVVIDIAENRVMCDGLSMPHSPRWHEGRLWVLQSGNGGLGYLDAASGKYQSVIELPGFTRGLDFYGPYAFVGLSQVRETAIFSGIAIAIRPERFSGVWVIDLRNGQTAAFLKFEDAVEEIFAVQVLPGIRWPEVVKDDPVLLGESFPP
jgi:uncharacterized protein (TIGR03032 family)